VNEAREIYAAMQERRRGLRNREDSVRFERDFGHFGILDGNRAPEFWFTEHPKIEPVAEIYYYDFAEKRLRVHR
jgi:hypothetical protein